MHTMDNPKLQPKVAALIACSGRFELLEHRALSSVRSQVRPPDVIVIVVDADYDQEGELEMKSIVKRVWNGSSVCPEVITIGNRRTKKSASGAWNSGLDELCRRFSEEAERWHVAVLDDDDAWAEEHLHECLSEAIKLSADMIIPGLIRHEVPDDEGRRQEIPTSLNPAHIFVRNTHIQGSNIFLRLARFLEVGGFDENLPSCTDRDICIRLARLAGMKVAPLAAHTVHHYADPRPDRLTINRNAKGEGLRKFFQKHAQDFGADEHDRYFRLALERFGFDEAYLRSSDSLPAPALQSERLPAKEVQPDGLHFVLGVATDSCLPPQALRLFGDISRLCIHPGVLGVTAVLLENGPVDEEGRLKCVEAIKSLRSSGVNIRWIKPEEVMSHWAPEQAVVIPDAHACRLPIAITRSILNYFVQVECKQRPGSAAWILDDDKTFSFEVRGEFDSSVSTRCSPDVAQLLALRAEGVDVVIGQDSAAAPLPFEATLRLQLLDLDQALRRRVSSSGDHVPKEAAGRRAAGYYDLSRETRYLETPLRTDLFDGLTPVETINKAAHACRRMRAGESIMRPLMIDGESLDLAAAQDSIMRGGSTVFFRPEQLMLCPQYVARVGGAWVRRSDMLHSLILSRLYGVKIVMHASAAVRHGRETTSPVETLSETLSQDVLGYGLYRGAEAALSVVPAHPARGICGVFYEGDNNQIATATARKAVRERLAVMELSAWRIRGLVGSCLCSLDKLSQEHGIDATAVSQLDAELHKIMSLMDPDYLRQTAKALLASVSGGEFSSAYEQLELQAVAMQTSFKAFRTEQLKQQRVERARKILGVPLEAELLGAGWEGVVFRSEDSTIKLLDVAKPARASAAMPALRLMGKLPSEAKGLRRIKLRCCEAGLLVIEREYVEQAQIGPPSIGQLFSLMEECKASCVVFRNLSRDNIALVRGQAVIIDYGLDFREFSHAEFESMARKAWLCVRFWARPDLNRLLSLAWQDQGAPELDGFQEFWHWYVEERKSATAVCAEMVEVLFSSHDFESVLDYGCGKKAYTARRFSAAGKRVVGFDPGDGIKTRWERDQYAKDLTLTDSRELAISGGPYDAVVCSLVLCELRSEKDFQQVVADLGASVKNTGRVVVVICDPLSTFGPPTAIHLERKLPQGAEYPLAFDYEEIAESGRPRTEFHRPISNIRRALLASGLHVISEKQNHTFDLKTGLPAVDFIGWECEPVKLIGPGADVSLVIKASALEAETLEAQVEHLIGQLEAPRTFVERILTIDSRSGGFVREYGTPDLSKTIEAGRRLKARGIIDQVIMAPADGSEEAAAINHRWFGVESASSHTKAGAPLASPLGAFDLCRGDYILQLDSDLLIRRADKAHDFVGEAIMAMKANPGTITVSLNILNQEDQPFGANDADGRPYRVECRGCFFDRAALLALRPFANTADDDGKLELAWHRSMDKACVAGRAVSLRGGDRRTGFVHPPNCFKRSDGEWNLIMAGIENGALFEAQLGKVDLVGSALQWLPAPRREKLVFVVTGRNVPYGKMLRCCQSMLRQRGGIWGAIVIDDGSDELSREACRRVFGQAPNITLLQPRRRRGQLANTITAIRDLCADPEAVIVTLDMDDSLIGSDVLQELAQAHDHGADLTVGSMVRTDKPADYPACFGDLGAARGGNVWQHLRSFRKRLFDGIPDWRLRLDGKYVEICVDWAFMIPMVERATAPRHLPSKLYYYESSGLGKAGQLAAREAAIARIMKRHVPGGHCRRSSGLITKEDIMARDWKDLNGLLILRHADRPSLKGLGKGADEVSITERGRMESYALGAALGQATQIVASGVLRASQTAEEIRRGIGHDSSIIRTFRSLCRLSANHADSEAYDAHKHRLGWHALVDAWVDGALDDPGAVLPSHESAMGAIRELMADDGLRQQGLNIVITHDFYVHALLEVMHGQRQWRGRGIPTLAGVYLDYEDARSLMEAHGA
jgi:broad specificity phosphatase PhoE